DVRHHDVTRAGDEQQVEDGGAGGPRPGEHDAHVRELLAHHGEGVLQCGDHDDRGAVLIVVEDGDVQLLAEPLLDLEAAGCGDVLEVDPGEPRRDGPHDGDDLLDVGGVQTQRE